MDFKIERHLDRRLRAPLTALVLLSCLGLGSAAAQDIPADADTAVESGAEHAARPLTAALSQRFDAPEAPEVGDRLRLTLEVTHPLHTTVHLPEALPNSRWEVLNQSEAHTPGDEQIVTEITLTFQIFRPGATTLPAFDVTVVENDGTLEKLKTQPIKTTVLSVLPGAETPELASPRAPVAVWTDDYTLLWAGGGLLALVFAGGVGFFISRRNRPEPPPPPPRPAHLVALEKLSALTPGELLEGGEYMLFYVRMSEAVREYLGRRYGFPGTELTTTEILAHLKTVEHGEGWPQGISFADVRDWLNYCDLVKFSDFTPPRERSEQLLRQAFSTVELTHRVPTTSPKPTASGDATAATQNDAPRDDEAPESEDAPKEKIDAPRDAPREDSVRAEDEVPDTKHTREDADAPSETLDSAEAQTDAKEDEP